MSPSHKCSLDCAPHSWMAMTQENCAVAHRIVDESMALLAPLVSALGTLNIDRKRLAEAAIVSDTAWQDTTSPTV